MVVVYRAAWCAASDVFGVSACRKCRDMHECFTLEHHDSQSAFVVNVEKVIS